MDKRKGCNNINRNTSNLINHLKNRVIRNNIVTPEIFVSEIWMQEHNKNCVEIIELNSSNSEVEETSQQSSNNFGQAWSFMNHDRFQHAEDEYRINKIARERRRMKNEAKLTEYANEYLHDHDTQTNFNGYHYVDDSGVSHGEQMNCFTIINNHVVDSDSSSDNEYARVEPHFAENNTSDKKYWDHVYKDYHNNSDIRTYDPVNSEKRTVWIYSFKNKHRLSENDFELINIPSKDSTDTSISPTSDEERITDGGSNVRRTLSPIPATYIPRLDLSLAQTLSTVTEISEVKNSDESLVIKPINNWLTERNIKQSTKKLSNVVNWMSLSPRERRRRFKNTNSDSESQDAKETSTYAEGYTKYEELSEKSRNNSLIEVEAEIHANDIPNIKELSAADIEKVSIGSSELKPKEKKKVAKTLSIDISYADADTEIDNENGDHNFDPNTKPCIKLTSEKTYDVITEPIEKLNSSRWIVGDEKVEEQEPTPVFDYFLGNENVESESFKSADVSNSASKRLWMKSTKLMKSPQWTDYLPITRTPPSLHLSLSHSSINGKKSWFKSIVKYFKCCK